MSYEQELLHQLNKHAIHELKYKITNIYPHDRECFTEGLVYKDGYLYESCGLIGLSKIQKVELETGNIVQEKRIDYFGEGLAHANNKFYQLTWKDHIGLIYDENLTLIDTWKYTTQGWGLTYLNGQFIMSDGSVNLHIYDSEFHYLYAIKVTIGDFKVKQINCLAAHNGYIYANIYPTSLIIKIERITGNVIAYIDLINLLEDSKDPEDVLNGLTFNENKLYVTGKRWSHLYQLAIM